MTKTRKDRKPISQSAPFVSATAKPKASRCSALPVIETPTLQTKCSDCFYFKFGHCGLTRTSGHRQADASCPSFTTEAPPVQKTCSQCGHWKHGYCAYHNAGGYKRERSACDVFCLGEESVSQEQPSTVTPVGKTKAKTK